MMPHQSQGACMAIEDAAALGILFSEGYFAGDIPETLAVYQEVRLPRATKVQATAARAAYNINERIGKQQWHWISSLGHSYVEASLVDTNFTGFSSNTNNQNYKVQDEKAKLTIEEMNG
jgi:salicylate hydroxylase